MHIVWLPPYSFLPSKQQSTIQILHNIPSPTGGTKTFQYLTFCNSWRSLWYSQTLYLRWSMDIASFTPSLVVAYDFLYSKEHYFWKFSETWSSASTQVFGNLPQGFLFPCSLGVPVGQHMNKMTISIMCQWAEFGTAGGEEFYGKDLGMSGILRRLWSDQACTCEMQTLYSCV